MNFRVALDTFRGPLDLLLYLVRKHELEISDIPIAVIADQYLQYLEVLEELDVNAVGDFLDLATTLMEIKSRSILPRAEEETETIEDPREELVQRLLDYKKFRDAASILDEQSRQWQQRYPRMANDLPPRDVDLAGQPIKELELWDLVSAFGRIIRDSNTTQPSSILYDDTPLHVYVERIHDRLVQTGRVALSELYVAGMHKSALIGMFLAVLELVRHHGVRTEQSEMHGEIWVLPGETFDPAVEFEDLSTDQLEPESPGDAALPGDVALPGDAARDQAQSATDSAAATPAPLDAVQTAGDAPSEPAGDPAAASPPADQDAPKPSRGRRRAR